jgi:PadR family transcriptional regulator PadR
MANIDTADKKFQKELNSGTAALVVLAVLSKAATPMYGYQIAKLIEGSTEQALMIKQGAFYPVLRSLDSSGLLQSWVEPSVSGPPRRYYTITETGRQTFNRWTKIWNRTKHFVRTILEGGPNDQEC